MELIENTPDPRHKRQAQTSTLGRNYLKYPSHYKSRLFCPEILRALEAITSRDELLESRLLQVATKFRLSEEEKMLLAINIATLRKPLSKETYVEKQLLNIFLELKKNSQNQFGFLTPPIETLCEIPGTKTSRAFIDIDKSALLRLNIKGGNKVAIETGTGRLAGTLETTGDKTSCFIVDERPDRIDRWSNVSIVKHDNMFLNLAYFSVINLVRENEYILDYLLKQDSAPQPTTSQPLQFLQSNLTDRQKEETTKALLNDGSVPTIITGPAGTGKSLVLAELGLQAARTGIKVLYISPTNQGVTNLYAIVRSLAEYHFKDDLLFLKLSSPAAVQIGEFCDLCFKDDLGNSHRYPYLEEINIRDIIFATPTVALRLGLLTEKNLLLVAY